MSSAKPANKLVRKDFVEHPVWQWVTDCEGETDESCVHPYSGSQVPQAEFRQYLVAATITLRDGAILPGCVEVTTLQGKRAQFYPLFVFLMDRQLECVSNETDRLLSRHTQFSGNRPVKWQLAVLLAGEKKLRYGSVRRSMLYLLLSFLIKIATRKLRR